VKPIGVELEMPWLSWHVFRRTYKILTYELGRQRLDRSGITARPEPGMPLALTTGRALPPAEGRNDANKAFARME
jgi:hypothetical protein